MMDGELLETIFNSYATWTVGWYANENIERPKNELLQIIIELHTRNYELWNQEDIARRRDVNDAVITKTKRAIDVFNQQRNDCIEKVDDWLLAHHYQHLAATSLPTRTETPGSAFDRLSILSLKMYHMEKQTQRTDVAHDHIERCSQRLQIMKTQQQDLREALRIMFRDLDAGIIRLRVYRQFKMYNDPSLNPQLYAPKPLSSK